MPAIDFRALFELSPNSYMLLDRQLRYVAANRAYLDITGRRLEDLLGRNIFAIFPHDPEDPSNESATQLRQSFERVLNTGQADVIAFIRYRVPGESVREGDVEDRFWSATHTPIHDSDGQGFVDAPGSKNLRFHRSLRCFVSIRARRFLALLRMRAFISLSTVSSGAAGTRAVARVRKLALTV